jgi:hypothetical protein
MCNSLQWFSLSVVLQSLLEHARLSFEIKAGGQPYCCVRRTFVHGSWPGCLDPFSTSPHSILRCLHDSRPVCWFGTLQVDTSHVDNNNV